MEANGLTYEDLAREVSRDPEFVRLLLEMPKAWEACNQWERVAYAKLNESAQAKEQKSKAASRRTNLIRQ